MNDPVLETVGELVADIESDLDEDRSLITKAVIVAETMAQDGTRWLRITRSVDVLNWEIRGMLLEVLADLDAFDVVDVLREETE